MRRAIVARAAPAPLFIGAASFTTIEEDTSLPDRVLEAMIVTVALLPLALVARSDAGRVTEILVLLVALTGVARTAAVIVDRVWHGHRYLLLRQPILGGDLLEGMFVLERARGLRELRVVMKQRLTGETGEPRRVALVIVDVPGPHVDYRRRVGIPLRLPVPPAPPAGFQLPTLWGYELEVRGFVGRLGLDLRASFSIFVGFGFQRAVSPATAPAWRPTPLSSPRS